jgi:NAD(P)-dependent dehydrogenase (short-subunit alcohol dehydrogenase family)
MNIETLPGWTIVVAGATGLVGVGLVRAFRLAGATVIAPVRDDAERLQLQSQCEDVIGGDLITEQADLNDAGSASDFSEWLARNFAGFDVAVIAPAAWETITNPGNAVRALLPWLNEERGVLAHVSTAGEEAAHAGVFEQIGQHTVGMIDLIIDTLLPRQRASESAYDGEQVGSYLVRLVDQASPSTKIVRHVSLQVDSQAS